MCIPLQAAFAHFDELAAGAAEADAAAAAAVESSSSSPSASAAASAAAGCYGGGTDRLLHELWIRGDSSYFSRNVLRAQQCEFDTQCANAGADGNVFAAPRSFTQKCVFVSWRTLLLLSVPHI